MSYSFQKWAGIFFINMHIQTILLPGAGLEAAALTAERVIPPSRNAADHWPSSLGGCWEMVSPQSPCLTHPWVLDRGGVYSPAQSVHSTGPVFPTMVLLPLCPKPSLAGMAPAGLGGLVKVAAASGRAQPSVPVVSLFLYTFAQPGPPPSCSAGLAGELTYGTGPVPRLLYQRAQEEPSPSSPAAPTFSPLSRCTKSWASHQGVGFCNRKEITILS